MVTQDVPSDLIFQKWVSTIQRVQKDIKKGKRWGGEGEGKGNNLFRIYYVQVLCAWHQTFDHGVNSTIL